VVKLDVAGNPTYARALGGSADDGGYGIALDASGAAYLTEYTSSSDFLPPYGNDDAFVVKLAAGAPPTPTPTATATATHTPTRTPTATPTRTPTPTLLIQVGRCGLTEHYDTQNFRIYYTRTYPNVVVVNQETGLEEVRDVDCRLVAPDGNINTPLSINPNGYPEFVVMLGASLEKSRNHYATQMGYPVNRIPLQNSRYPVYVSSDPIWTKELPFPIQAWAMAFPNVMYVSRGNQYNPAQPTDRLRAIIGPHEFFHTIQWTYLPNPPIIGQVGNWATSEELRWWMEATAVWAEPKVEPRNGSYPRELDVVLGNPQHALIKRPLDRAGPSYGSFIFASFLEQKVAAPRNLPDPPERIIRKIWQQYADNSHRGMLDAIDQVLRRREYGTTLADAFPNFTWNNYFLNRGTYDQRLNNIYPDVENPGGGPVSMAEWELFRSWLRGDRGNHQNGNAGVRTDRRDTYPVMEPSPNYSPVVGPLSAGYVEFMRPNAIGTNTTLSVTLDIHLPTSDPDGFIRASVLPIGNFINLPHPANHFLVSTPLPLALTPTYRHTVRIANFHQCDRVTLSINNIHRLDFLRYEYTAELVPPLTAPAPPCSLLP